MTDKMKDDSIVEVKLHSRNKHQGRYDFDQLKQACPELVPYIIKNKYDNESIEFSNPEAVKQLNSALLKQFYDIANWDIPANYLCPPIPGRADYIHNVADLLTLSNDGKLPLGTTIKCLDIGVGANCIYPIIGVKEYGWSFVGSEIDTKAADFAKSNVASNEGLIGRVEIRTQKDSSIIFQDIIQEGETFDLSICNPPFHGSKAEANAGTMRKLSNLKKKKVSKKVLNFGGQSNELWCRGSDRNIAYGTRKQN
jgi:23S rRNA (adenine1618-N6)-methyltransferase